MADLYRYWRESPPVHELVAAYLGYKPPSEPVAPGSLSIGSSFAEMKAAFDRGEKSGVA